MTSSTNEKCRNFFKWSKLDAFPLASHGVANTVVKIDKRVCGRLKGPCLHAAEQHDGLTEKAPQKYRKLQTRIHANFIPEQLG